MITRYAYIVDGNTVWGPGPMPYFITLNDGTRWEITAHSIEESEEVGVFVVEQVDYREYDDRFERANVPTYEIVDGRPREVWTYYFIPVARENMKISIDEHAESIRSTLATKYPGQYAEYDQVYSEALAVQRLPVEDTISPTDYPYLNADVNMTFSPALDRVVQDIREAAQLIVSVRETFKTVGGNIRKDRFIAKKGINDAASDSEAKIIHDAFIATTLADYF